MDKDAERKIVKALRRGDATAWLKVYETYAEKLWRNIARVMPENSGQVGDVVQETLLAAARSAQNFDIRRGSLWLWLCGIAKRQVALHYRKNIDKKLFEAQQWWNSLDGQKKDWIDAKAEMPLEVLESSELGALVRVALGELPAEYQAMLIAKYIDGETVKTIAKQVKKSEVAVRSKLARARRAFRKAFRRITNSAPSVREAIR